VVLDENSQSQSTSPMPEELVIFLVVLIGAVWLLVKLFQGISVAIGNAEKSFSEAAARRRANRRSKGRNTLGQYVYALIPGDLDRFEKTLETARTEFQQAQKLTTFVAHPPVWTREKFQSQARPRKRSGYAEMSIHDIAAMLTPDSESSTWTAKESGIVVRQCKYPSARPRSSANESVAFPTVAIDLKMAVFTTYAERITKKDADRYFSDEQAEVLAYNKRRADLIAKAANLNSAIQEWNKNTQTSWGNYIAESKQMLDTELLAFQDASDLYTKACSDEKIYFTRLLEGYKKGNKQSVVERLDYVLDHIDLPASVPHTWDIDFDEEQKIAIVEVALPDVVHRPPHKIVILKSGPVTKPLNQTERKEFVPKIHPAIMLRIAHEIFRSDTYQTIHLLVLNGWVKFDDPATGTNTKAYTASLMVTRDQITALNLTKIEPLVAFDSLHGKSAGRLIEIIPIEPALSLNREDSRFVNSREVLSALGSETNLAAMDWQDFEHLIRELFEKEFSGRGAEVKITQASRDRGVDAIVFDPDPIHGGKYVIQAKRYTNTVDVSAVRDLCAVVKKEGASRGILVTTSTYGADAYAFANNEPITLLNGAELLGLLRKHGYTFRINLQEARRSV
jgi:hypothetical protein